MVSALAALFSFGLEYANRVRCAGLYLTRGVPACWGVCWAGFEHRNLCGSWRHLSGWCRKEERWCVATRSTGFRRHHDHQPVVVVVAVVVGADVAMPRLLCDVTELRREHVVKQEWFVMKEKHARSRLALASTYTRTQKSVTTLQHVTSRGVTYNVRNVTCKVKSDTLSFDNRPQWLAVPAKNQQNKRN